MNSSSISTDSIMIPPRLLGGAALLFWGAMTEEVVLSLLFAVLLEARSWFKWSWDFDDSAYVKAFQVSLGLLGLALFIVWMGEVDYHSLNKMMKWFPICLLPIELAQRYGRRNYMNMNTFFYFARQKMKQDIKEGKPFVPNVFNTGYPYIFIVIVLSSCSNRMDAFAVIAMLVLLVAIIASFGVQRGLSWKRMVWAIPLMLVFVLWGQYEVLGKYKFFKKKFGGDVRSSMIGKTSANRTWLGNLGEVKQTQEVQWRMWGDNSPEYLRLNIYNQSNLDGWSYNFRSKENPQIENLDDAFDTRTGIQIGKEGESLFVFESLHVTRAQQYNGESIRIRGAGVGSPDSEESVVPSIPGFYAISDLHGDEVRAAVHPLGVLKLVEREAVIDYNLWYSPENILDQAPDYKDTVIGSRALKESVMQLSQEMGLSEYSDDKAKVEAIRRFFNLEFTYSLAKNKKKIDERGEQLLFFMGASKEEGGRTGHCEYFATTAALLLREHGIPTRYCVGYVVKEKSGNAWVMRGTHMHAWCTAWINGAWQIVDLTPPDWLSIENDNLKKSWARGFKDLFHNIKQDFLMWRTVDTNKQLMNKVMIGLGGVLLLWVAYRLFRSKQRDQAEVKSLDFEYDVSSDLLSFEGELQEHFGERVQSQTYYHWITSGEGKVDQQLFSSLREFISMHEESRFGGKDRREQMAQLSSKIKSLLE